MSGSPPCILSHYHHARFTRENKPACVATAPGYHRHRCAAHTRAHHTHLPRCPCYRFTSSGTVAIRLSCRLGPLPLPTTSLFFYIRAAKLRTSTPLVTCTFENARAHAHAACLGAPWTCSARLWFCLVGSHQHCPTASSLRRAHASLPCRHPHAPPPRTLSRTRSIARLRRTRRATQALLSHVRTRSHAATNGTATAAAHTPPRRHRAAMRYLCASSRTTRLYICARPAAAPHYYLPAYLLPFTFHRAAPHAHRVPFSHGRSLGG